MDQQERTRFALLQEDARNGVEFASEKLSLADLLLLLREDGNLRTIIRDIVATPVLDASQDQHGADSVGPAAEHSLHAVLPIDTAPVPIDALRQQLGPELALLDLVRADADLASAWLNGQLDEGRQLLQLVVCAAQWDVLADLWDKLASRCKQAQRGASADELSILQSALALHNLRWRDRQARLVDVAAGTAYDYERHQRGTSTGDSVRAQWLPGLLNAGGQLHKKPLVQT